MTDVSIALSSSRNKLNSLLEKHENHFQNEIMQKISSKVETTLPKFIEETVPSYSCENTQKVFCEKLPMCKDSMSSTSVLKKPTDIMNQFIINVISESGSTFLSQIESDPKLIEEVLGKMGLKVECKIKEACRLEKYKNRDTDEHRQCRPLLISTNNPCFMEKFFARSRYLKDFLRLSLYEKLLTRAERELEKNYRLNVTT